MCWVLCWVLLCCAVGTPTTQFEEKEGRFLYMLTRLLMTLISMMYICFLLFYSSIFAHEQPGLSYNGIECSKPNMRPFVSYHIHALFWQSNNNSITAANNLKYNFGEHFGINDDATAPKHSVHARSAHDTRCKSVIT